MSVTIVAAEAEARLDWIALTAALEAGHRRPKAEIGDTFLYRGGDTLLSRAAWIDGMGLLVKSATVFPGNAGRGAPSINGGVSLFSDLDGTLEAILDFHLVTKWKTAGDSLLAALKLAPKDTRTILIVGAGTVARSLREAYGAAFPDARFLVWNRSRDQAMRLASWFPDTEVIDDLAAGVARADVITCATMTTTPVIRGDWLRPGQHLDLIGAYRPDMREADDEVLRRGRLFVDARHTTIGHIGEVMIPMEAGVIGEDDILGDFYDLPHGGFARESEEEITVFKNGGGAHLDLMCARYILGAVQSD
jgi:ornithine cyclodeaminase/alanine dehydrogenase-like protein (mu-crystallin family)